MKSDAWYQRFGTEKIEERLLLIGFVIVSAFMLWETTNFSISSAGRFPRLTGSVVLIGSLLLLFQAYLPKPLRTFVAEEVEMFSADEGVAEQREKAEGRTTAEESAEEESRATGSSVGRPLNDSVFTAIAAVGYGLLGYTIGIFLATPLFVIVYTRWFKVKWYYSLPLAALGLLIAFAFYSVLNIPLDRGEIFFTEGVL
ncbi:tripartite tricarboxylate transporter TctB family protein (plasmid) [Haloferacaceae archaeon DSL9]